MNFGKAPSSDSRDDHLQIFSEALEAEGIDAEVTCFTDSTKLAEVFQIRFRKNGKRFGRDVSIDERMLAEQNTEQVIVREAERVAREVRSEFEEVLRWNDNIVRFDVKDALSVRCEACSSSVSTEDLKSNMSTFTLAESTTPNPTTTSDIESLSEHKLRFSLLALLDIECEENGCHRKL